MKTMEKKKQNIGMQHSPSSSYSDWHAYVWANNSPSVKTFSKDSLLRGVDSSFMSQKGTAAETGSYCMLRNFLFASNHCSIFSASKVSTSTGEEGGRHSLGILFYPILHHCCRAPFSAGPPLVWGFLLPPGEKRSSTLETLCVGLAVGSLRCSGCFNNYWGHLDQL